MKTIIIKYTSAGLLLFLWGCTPVKKSTSDEVGNFDKNKTTHFFVLGDWGRKGLLDQKNVAEQMKTYAKTSNPSFCLVTGDNFYEDGVKDIYDDHWKTSFEDVYKPLTTAFPWYVSLGNHDYRGSPQAEIDYHTINTNWIMPDRYYTTVIETKDGQKVRLVCIDTSPFYADYYSAKNMTGVLTQDTVAQLHWIEKTLADAKEPWKIVFGHHPVYSAALRGGTPELISRLAPILEKYKVQAYICGHDHNLQHNHNENSYVDYFVSGGGSEVKDSIKFNPAKFAASIAGFADISIKGDSLFLNFIDKTGTVIYHYGRRK